MMLQAILLRAALFGFLWWVLVGGAPESLPAGVVASGLAVALSLRLRPAGRGRFSALQLPGFIAYFLWASIRGGLQVARMALQPRLDLHPAIQEVVLHLPDDSSRVFLTITLTLFPGTLSTSLEADRLQLHVLDRRQPVERDVRQAERWVARMFRIPL